MGFLRNLITEDPDDVRVRAYLAEGPPGPRTDWLAANASLRIAGTPIAQRERLGEVVTVPDLAPSSEVVRQVMAQDRDLSAWVARKAVMQLKAVLSGAITGDLAGDFRLGFAAMGLEIPDRGQVGFLDGNSAKSLSDTQAEAAKAMGNLTIEMMKILVTPAQERPRLAGWDFYVDLYTGGSGQDVETMAYDLTAWVSVLVARLLNEGRVPPVPFLTAEFRHVPRLQEAAWYPNPAKHGEIVNGVATLQRYWDGQRWTDRVRIRDTSGWQTGSFSLHDRPSD
jgi:Protein of unknown function (DUF2510)